MQSTILLVFFKKRALDTFPKAAKHLKSNGDKKCLKVALVTNGFFNNHHYSYKNWNNPYKRDFSLNLNNLAKEKQKAKGIFTSSNLFYLQQSQVPADPDLIHNMANFIDFICLC